MNRTRITLTGVLLATWLASAHAQTPLWHWDGAAPRDEFGVSVTGVGDLDGDGRGELLVGAYRHSSDAGAAYLFAGADGSLLETLAAGGVREWFGHSVATAADLDGDGVPEFFVGAPRNRDAGSDAGKAYLFSGQTRQLHDSSTGDAAGDNYGWCFAMVGDFDGDGTADYLVGAPRNDRGGIDAGSVFLRSGATGVELLVLSGEEPGDRFGHAVASVPDTDGDGSDDFLVGAPFHDGVGLESGRAYLYSGADGALLRILSGVAAGDHFGQSVAGLEDWDGDQAGDLAVGAPFHGSVATSAGRVTLFSGAQGTVLRDLDGDAAQDQFGFALGNAGDFDGDQRDDLVVGAWGNDASQPGAGKAVVLQGGSGDVLLEALGQAGADRFGVAVGCGGDVNGDGSADVIVGATMHDSGGINAGRACVFPGLPAVQVLDSSPPRGRYDRRRRVTLSGFNLDAGAPTEVLIGGRPAGAVTVLADGRIRCRAPRGQPGPAAVEVRNALGEGVLQEGFIYTPALRGGGDLRPGGHVELRWWMDPGDSLVAFWGLPPRAPAAPMTGYGGALSMVPLQVLMVAWDLPGAEFLDVRAIPADPAFSGLHLLVQGLVGPRDRSRSVAWTNCIDIIVE